jgi:DNA-binding NarL/FixJ family response regulator
VLLVDDHDQVRTQLRRLLEDAGVRVVAEAADGVEAVAAALAHQPEVVVMDLAMPRMNGYEATRLITAEQPWIRVVAHTALTEPGAEACALAAGACAVVPKGIRSDRLLTAISRAAAITPAAGARRPG